MFNAKNLNLSLNELGLKPNHILFEKLQRSYSESTRHYHTINHISECLSHFQEVHHLANKPVEIEMAFWFHDAIYDTHKTDNEEKSAEWAHSFLRSEGAHVDSIKRIVDMILATKTHNTQNGDTALLVDIDLGILGAPERAFEKYDREIRLEYHWVPEEKYKSARAQILTAFLSKNVIYQTKLFFDRYEMQARKNLTKKISELTN